MLAGKYIKAPEFQIFSMRFSCSLFQVFIAAATAANSTNGTEGSGSAALPDWADAGVAQLPNLFDHNATDANQVAPGYDLLNISGTNTGLTGILKLRGKPENIYGYDYDFLNLTVQYQADKRLNVRIAPVNLTDVFLVPESVVPLPKVESVEVSSEFLFKYQKEQFGFSVIRKSTGEELFSTIGNPLVFENQFIQLNTTLPKNHRLSGLGEAIHGSRLTPGTNRTIYDADQPNEIDVNEYGNHPVYYDQRYVHNTSSTTHAVWWRTSAIQEVLVRDTSLTWRALSGIVDLYFFAGPTPYDAIEQYVSQVGLPAFQQYWTLGYHQTRWGYDTLAELEEVVENFKAFDLPLEAIWNDIDPMDQKRDFTVDPYRYPASDFKKFIEKLHKQGQHYVPLFDAAVYVPNPTNHSESNYSTYINGKNADIFLKNPDGSDYIGAVWPGYTVFPDFFANGSEAYWTKEIAEFHKTIPFDGIWFDMNEASSFCVGSCGSGEGKLEQNPVTSADVSYDPLYVYPRGFNITNATEWEAALRNSSAGSTDTNLTTAPIPLNNDQNTLAPNGGRNINYPPYVVNNKAQVGHDLAKHAISPNATHANGVVEYDSHNIYGLMTSFATYKGMLRAQPGKRPFIITRSTSMGSGSKVAHWGGDNHADWAWAYFSIPQAFAMGSFGIPYFGVDTCGFNGNTNFELCSRWMQLSSFFPFYRNHNVLAGIPQEPYRWEATLTASKTSMNIRYLLLPYYYTLLHEAHATGRPFLRQLQWEFPDDEFYADVDNQFLVGSSLLVTPVLEPNVSTVKGVFPASGSTEIWYDWYTHERQNFTNSHANYTLNAPLGHIPLHVRGGSVLPVQEPAYSVEESRKNPFGVIAALDKKGHASGELYLDDGESLDVKESLFVDFVVENNTVTASPRGNYDVKEPLANVTIMGVEKAPKSAAYFNKTVPFSYENNTVFITGLQNYTTSGAWASEWTISWN